MTFSGISFINAAPGILLVLFGVVLGAKRMKIAGLVVALLGLGIIVIPALASF